jgi:hypothetical protein
MQLGWLLFSGAFGVLEMRCALIKRGWNCLPFLTYWAGLLKEGLKEQVIQGAEVVKTTALLFHKQDLKSCLQEEHQLVPFVGWRPSRLEHVVCFVPLGQAPSVTPLLFGDVQAPLNFVSGASTFKHVFPLRSYA